MIGEAAESPISSVACRMCHVIFWAWEARWFQQSPLFQVDTTFPARRPFCSHSKITSTKRLNQTHTVTMVTLSMAASATARPLAAAMTCTWRTSVTWTRTPTQISVKPTNRHSGMPRVALRPRTFLQGRTASNAMSTKSILILVSASWLSLRWRNILLLVSVYYQVSGDTFFSLMTHFQLLCPASPIELYLACLSMLPLAAWRVGESEVRVWKTTPFWLSHVQYFCARIEDVDRCVLLIPVLQQSPVVHRRRVQWMQDKEKWDKLA